MNKKLVFWICLAASLLAVFPAQVKGAAQHGELQRLAGTRAVLGGFLNIMSGDEVDNVQPVVALNSERGEFLVVWTTKESDSTWTLWGRRVQANGVMDFPFLIFRNIDRIAHNPVLVFNPDQDEYLLVYTYYAQAGVTDNYDIHGIFISADASQLSDPFLISATMLNDEVISSAAYSPTEKIFLVVYDQVNDTEKRIMGREIPSDFDPGSSNELPKPAFEIAGGANQQRFEPDVAYQPADGNFMVVYTLASSQERGVRAKLLPEGLDPGSFSEEIVIADTNGNDITPSVAAGEGEYLVAYSSMVAPAQSVIYGRRLALNGEPQGPQGGFLISDIQGEVYRRNPDVAELPGYGYMIVMDYLTPGTGDAGDIFSQRVPTGSDQAEEVTTIDASPYLQENPSVACHDIERCLVVYEHHPLPLPTGDVEIRGAYPGQSAIYLPVIPNGAGTR